MEQAVPKIEKGCPKDYVEHPVSKQKVAVRMRTPFYFRGRDFDSNMHFFFEQANAYTEIGRIVSTEKTMIFVLRFFLFF